MALKRPLVTNSGGLQELSAGDLIVTSFPVSPAFAATITLDCATSNVFNTLLTGNTTFALSNESSASRFMVAVTQDATGSRIVTWFATIRWAGGVVPTLTTAANKRDIFGFIRTGLNTYDGFVVGKNI